MAKRPDKPVYSFLRKGNYLVPELEYDVHALDGVAQGQRVRVEIKEFRNVARLRAYWSMLHEVVAATGANRLTAERLHEVAKLQNGCVDVIMLPSGLPVAVPSSIALDKMTEAEFVAFFEKVREWLSATYGYTPSAEAEPEAGAQSSETAKALHGASPAPASAYSPASGGH